MSDSPTASDEAQSESPEQSKSAALESALAELELAERTSLADRLTFALRQAALMAVALFLVGRVASRLRPSEALGRDIVATPFLWAIVVWLAVLLVNAISFERSQMRVLERVPLMIGLAFGGLIGLIGIATLSSGNASRRIAYIATNSLGGVLFWWGLASLVTLVALRLREPTNS